MKTDLEPCKSNLEGISKNVTNRTFLLYIDLKAKVEAYSVQSRKTESARNIHLLPNSDSGSHVVALKERGRQVWI